MTDILLVRHATCDPIGRCIAGRAPGVTLNAEGRAEAAELARDLSDVRLDAIYASPLERTAETAAAVARGRDIVPRFMPELLELDFGRWTGCTFSELSKDPEWQLWNTARSVTRIPGGETILEAQARVVKAIELIRQEWPEGTCAVVSHGDLIRSAVAYALGMPIDYIQRFDVRPASVSVLRITESGIRVLCVNYKQSLSSVVL